MGIFDLFVYNTNITDCASVQNVIYVSGLAVSIWKLRLCVKIDWKCMLQPEFPTMILRKHQLW